MSYQTTPGGSSSAAPTSSLAVISLIAGIIGLTIVPIAGSIVAVITAPMAKREIRESGGSLSGEGIATAGQVLGWVGIGLTTVGLCVAGIAIAIPFCIGLFAIASERTGMILPLLLSVL